MSITVLCGLEGKFATQEIRNVRNVNLIRFARNTNRKKQAEQLAFCFIVTVWVLRLSSEFAAVKGDIAYRGNCLQYHSQ